MRTGRNDPCGCGGGKKFADCHYWAVRKSGAPDYAEYQRREKVAWLVGTLLKRADDYRGALERQTGNSTVMVLTEVVRHLRIARESLADAAAKTSGASDLQILTFTEFTVDEMLESVRQIDAYIGVFGPWLATEEALADRQMVL